MDPRRRNLFAQLAKPLRALVRSPHLPPGYASPNPPSGKPVLRGGAEAEVLALLGGFASGAEAAGGYRLTTTDVREDEIDYFFERPHDGRCAIVTLTGLTAAWGAPRATSVSFRVLACGDAPDEERDAVCDQVAAEIVARDQGHLWVRAADAPARSR